MNKLVSRFLSTYILLCGFLIKVAAQPASPNIIFIIGDDISWNDLGTYGNPYIKTPHLDKLAKDGLKFTNFFLTASSCSPSRTSILTGRYPHNTGAAELHSPLPEHLTFFPELLQKKGYYTALAGKWHEGPATKRAYDSLFVNKELNGEGAEEQWTNIIKSRPKNKPFFLWLAPLDAHRPWSKNPKGYAHNPETEVLVPPTLVDTKETRQDLANYYDEIARLDYYVGELERELEREGIAQNTIIIFTADNGRAFPGSKTRLTDAGVKTPFLIKWPKGIKPGQVSSSLVSSIDIAPTLLELAEIRAVPTIQGSSFVRLLKKPSEKFRTYVFSEHNWHDYEAYERSVRTKDYLYIINKRPNLDNGGPIDANQSPSALALKDAYKKENLTLLQKDIFLNPRPTEEFFDSTKDPLQSKNELPNDAYQIKINSLKQILVQWQEETGDTVPENLTPDWYDRETGKPLPEKNKRGEMPGKAKNADHNNAKGPF